MLAAQGERVMVLDWDAHHGNGTQEIFYERPEVLYVSLHQFPFYPGTGSVSETGAGPGSGTTVNLPFPAGTSGDAYRLAFDEVVVPAGRGVRPELAAHLGRLRRPPRRSADRPRAERGRLRRPDRQGRGPGATRAPRGLPRGRLRPRLARHERRRLRGRARRGSTTVPSRPPGAR